MDAKGAAMAAKKYFQDTKSIINFVFETISVKKDGDNWEVICLVQDLFEHAGKEFKVIVDSEGAILDVERLSQIPC